MYVGTRDKKKYTNTAKDEKAHEFFLGCLVNNVVEPPAIVTGFKF